MPSQKVGVCKQNLNLAFCSNLAHSLRADVNLTLSPFAFHAWRVIAGATLTAITALEPAIIMNF